MRIEKLEKQLKHALSPYKAEVKRRAQGTLKHDYLVPAGPYDEQWDWDGFFIGISLLSDMPSEAIYLKNWALNYLEHTNPRTGFTPGLLTPQGRDHRLHHIKPFLAQGVYFASQALDEWAWMKPWYERLKLSVQYRERNLWNKRYDLGYWYDSMESGADNNVAVLPYPKKTVIGADVNALVYREYRALGMIAAALGQAQDSQRFLRRAAAMKRNINQHLWNSREQSYFNLDTQSGKHVARHTYSNYVPLWAGIASRARGRAMIKIYLLNPQKLWARFGGRTLAHNDPAYNNRAIIKPYSNWQGPVWPIANYLYMHALRRYGFKREARAIAEKMVTLCLRDIKKSGGMHENYHADTGVPLAAPNFVSWNLLVGQMIEEAKTSIDPMKL